MIITISSSGTNLESSIYSKFERCNFFLIVDLEENTALPMKNISRENPHEIGSKVGKLIVKLGINAIMTTDIGPSAFKIFKENNIKIYQSKGIIEDAIKQLKLGKLPEITKATVPSYSNWKKNKNH
jgi:predicted Fe-Mo cluster-binding NifX family protein